MTLIAPTLGARLRLCRRIADETQTAFGARLGVSRQAIAEFEADRIAPRSDILAKVCRAYAVSADWLLLGRGSMQGEG